MLFGREPVLWTTAIRGSILAGTAFGLKLSADQVAAIMLVSEAILALITRSQVSPVTKP